MQDFNGIKYKVSGGKDALIVVWAHGWGQSHAAFDALIAPFADKARHVAIDFPGFGQSAAPESIWGTADYADAMADFLREVCGDAPVLWVGHSFGCRVGLRMAAQHPALIKGLCLIAGAGIPRQLPLHKSLYFKGRIAVFKGLKKLIPLGLSEDWLRSKFGSADYRNADPVMRSILVKTVNEDLRGIAPKIACPVTLIYGENDTETPPQIGEKFHAALQNSKLVVLKGQDHYTVLGAGRHQVLRHVKEFIEKP